MFWFCLRLLLRSILVRRRVGFWGILRFGWSLCKYLYLSVWSALLLRRRFVLFFYLYLWFRTVDDVADGDAQPRPYTSVDSYLRAREAILLVGGDIDTSSPEDALVTEAYKLAAQCGVNIYSDVATLFTLMVAGRARTSHTPQPHLAALDAIAIHQDECILRLAIRVLDGDMNRFSEIAPKIRGTFSRIDWIADADFAVAKGAEMGEQSLTDEYIKTVVYDWGVLKRELGDNFGGIFRPRLLVWIFGTILVRRFDRLLRNVLSSRRIVP